MREPGIGLLTHPVSSKEHIEATFMEARVQEDIFPSGAFRIALPKLWRMEASGADVAPSAEAPVVPVARFTPGSVEAFGSDVDAKVVIYGAFLSRDVNGADWLRAFAESQGWQLVGLRELPTAYGAMGDAVALCNEGRLHRVLTVKDGNHLFLVDGSVQAGSAPTDPLLQEIGLMACSRFSLLAPSGQYFAEPMQVQKLRGKAVSASFLLPVSWTAVDGIDAPRDGAALHFASQIGNSNLGTLVAVLGGDHTTNVAALEAVVLEKLTAQGMKIKTPRIVQASTRGDVDFEIVHCDASWQRQEHIILSMRARVDGMPVTIQVVSATPDRNFEQWAMNRRVFDIVVETLSNGIVSDR